MPVEKDDIKLRYVPIRQAREMCGLRIVLGAFPIPGPWHEACKGIFHVKGLSYTRVRSSNEDSSDLLFGMDGSQSELIDWTAQSSAPVVIWNDERPRSLWNDQLYLAERLQPEPRLIPENAQERMTMFGLANELMGESGLIYLKRYTVTQEPLRTLPADAEERKLWELLASKYPHNEAASMSASKRIAQILSLIGEQLNAQQNNGRRYLIGKQLSALDIYWATACGYLDPMPEERCPMWDAFRGDIYGNSNADIAKALTSALKAHRDFIYEEHLELPIVF